MTVILKRKYNYTTKEFLVLNILCQFIAFSFGCVYCYFNPEELGDIIIAISLAVIIFNLPDILGMFINYNLNPIGYVMFLLLLSGLGFLFKLNNLLIIILAFFFILLQLTVIFNLLYSSNLLSYRTGVYLFIFISTSLYLSTWFYTSGYHSPFFIDKIIAGNAHIDTLFHTSISHIFSTHKVPSTGLHGIRYFHYHYGSHIIIAGLSRLVGTKPLVFYNLYYPMIFIPLMIKSLFLFSKEVGRFIKTEIKTIPLLILLIISLLFINRVVLGFSYAPFVSESYCFGILCSLFLFAGTFKILRNDTILNKQIILLIISIFGVLIVTLMKVSVGYLYFIFISFLFYRIYSFKNPYFIANIILGISFLMFYYLMYDYRDSTSSFLNHFLSVFNNLEIYSWVILLVGFIIWRLKTGNNLIKEVIIAYKSKQLLLFETLIVIALAGALPYLLLKGLTLNDYFYFASYQAFIGLGIAIPYILKDYDFNKISEKISKSISKKLSIAIVNIFILINIIFLSYNNLKAIKKDYNTTQFKISKNLDFKNFVCTINKIDYRNSYIFFINRNPENRLERFRDLKDLLIIPALTGKSLVYGVPEDKNSKMYSMNIYEDITYQLGLTLNEVFSECERLGYKNLLEVSKDYKIHIYALK